MTGAAGAERAFPWRRAMELGIGRLGLSPTEFWAMTPKELAAAMAGALENGAAALTRPGLVELMTRFPDRT